MPKVKDMCFSREDSRYSRKTDSPLPPMPPEGEFSEPLFPSNTIKGGIEPYDKERTLKSLRDG